MSRELLRVIEAVANEKEISKEILFTAIEEALAIATQKNYHEDSKIFVEVDRKTGCYKTFRRWEIVDESYEIESNSYQLYIDIALEKGFRVKVGDLYKEEIPSIEFGRIAAMSAKHLIMQKVREEEKRLMISKFKDKVGKIVYGEVKRVSREFIIVDIGSDAEGIIYRSDLLPKENYRLNDKFRSCILKIDENAKGHQIILTRTHKSMLKALLKVEVPEVSEMLMDIVNISRDPGSRSKVSVKSNDKRIDPVGSCVGMRGSRIQAITNELQGEKVDIVLWDENPAQYVMNALSPAEVTSIVQDEDKKTMQVAVLEDQFSQTIGKNGQNVRLASALTNWSINVVTENNADIRQQEEIQKSVNLFVDLLGINNDLAELLVKENFTSLEEIAYVNEKDLLKIDKFDKKFVLNLQENAKNMLISQALLQENEPSRNLLTLRGMTKEWADILVKNGISHTENLAELAIDDLREIISISEKQASSLIMDARLPWFKD